MSHILVGMEGDITHNGQCNLKGDNHD